MNHPGNSVNRSSDSENPKVKNIKQVSDLSANNAKLSKQNKVQVLIRTLDSHSLFA